jgi:hypothetical protein
LAADEDRTTHHESARTFTTCDEAAVDEQLIETFASHGVRAS